MRQSARALVRRQNDLRFTNRFFVGNGLDIGGGNDGLDKQIEYFPLMKSCKVWDRQDGDAQFLKGVGDHSYDFVYSSHCLEHLVDPIEGFRNWLRVLKPGGHFVMLVPDEDLYEQGSFPSAYNGDHKWTFTIAKEQSWSPRSINIFDLLKPYIGQIRILKIESLDSHYSLEMAKRMTSKGPIDQTMHGISESAIEVVFQKEPSPFTQKRRNQENLAVKDRPQQFVKTGSQTITGQKKISVNLMQNSTVAAPKSQTNESSVKAAIQSNQTGKARKLHSDF